MLERLRKIIVNYVEIDPETITEQTSLKVDLGLNSFELMNLIVEVEDTFQVEIDEREVMDFQNLGDVITYLSGKTAQPV